MQEDDSMNTFSLVDHRIQIWFINKVFATSNIVSDYYQQLLSAESFSEDALYKRQVVLATVQQKVIDVMASHLLQRFMPQEVLSATKSLGKDVCLGKDGIGVGFYLHYWDFLGPLVTRSVNLKF